MFQNTGSNYGVNEVLLASVLGSVVFSIFAAQPLVIVGVTGMFPLAISTASRLSRVNGANWQYQALSLSLISMKLLQTHPIRSIFADTL